MLKMMQEIKQRDKEQQRLSSQSWKSDKYMGSNREKFNIVIAFSAYQYYFRHHKKVCIRSGSNYRHTHWQI